jgi:hypothetical protein
MARSAHNRHPPTRSQSAHRPRWHDRSPPEPFFRFRSCRSTFGRNTRSLQPRPLARPTLGKKQPQRQYDGHTSPRASVSDTRVWQFAVLPSADAYCGATPTECVPFLGIAVSSNVNAVTFAPADLASASPWRTALPASSEPSVGIKMCRYMVLFPIRASRPHGRSPQIPSPSFNGSACVGSRNSRRCSRAIEHSAASAQV